MTPSITQLYHLTAELCWLGTRSEELHCRIAQEVCAMLGPTFPVSHLTSSVLFTRLVDPWRRQGHTTGTINRKRSVVRRMLAVALERGWITEIPVWPQERPRIRSDGKLEGRRHRILTVREERSILHAMAVRLSQSHYALFCMVLSETGCRVSELLQLRWEDVDTERRVLNIRHATKSGLSRLVPLTERALGALPEKRRDPLGKVDPLVFSHLSQSQLNHVFRRAKRLAKLDDPDITPHTLRHTFATRLVKVGCPLATVSRLLGHQSITTTMRYAHHSFEDVDHARRLLEGEP